jgi:hypothetical protein
MPRLMVVAALALCTVTPPVLAAEMPATPHAGQQTRTIKALSDDEIAALCNGKGMGMAKAAELNGYPGPIHVLALAALTRRYSGGRRTRKIVPKRPSRTDAT